MTHSLIKNETNPLTSSKWSLSVLPLSIVFRSFLVWQFNWAIKTKNVFHDESMQFTIIVLFFVNVFFYLILGKFHFGSRSSIIFSLHNFIGFNFLYSSFFVDIPKALIKCMHNIWIKTFFLRDKYSSLINFIFFICVWCHFLYWMSLDRFYLSFRKVEERRKCWRKWFHFGVWRRKMSYSGFFTQRLTQNEKKDES